MLAAIFIGLMMEAGCTFEMSENFYQIKRRKNPEDNQPSSYVLPWESDLSLSNLAFGFISCYQQPTIEPDASNSQP